MTEFPARRLLALVLPICLASCGPLMVALDEATDPLVFGNPSSRFFQASTSEECERRATEATAYDHGSFQVACFPEKLSDGLILVNVKNGVPGRAFTR